MFLGCSLEPYLEGGWDLERPREGTRLSSLWLKISGFYLQAKLCPVSGSLLVGTAVVLPPQAWISGSEHLLRAPQRRIVHTAEPLPSFLPHTQTLHRCGIPVPDPGCGPDASSCLGVAILTLCLLSPHHCLKSCS